MRRIIWLGLGVAALWCGWWIVATSSMERAILGWFDARNKEGWSAQVDDVARAGFPFALHSRVTGIAVVDPQTATGISASHIDVKAAAFWPGYVTVELPQTPIQLYSPDGNLVLELQQAQANLRLHPGPALQLESIATDVASWSISGTAGRLLSADTWHLSMVQSPHLSKSYTISLSSRGLTPSKIVRAGFDIPSSWPQSFDVFAANVSVEFDRPWDRGALLESRPQPRKILLENTQIVWGPLNATTTADLVIDEAGTPEGVLRFRAENWREALQMGKESFGQNMDPQTKAILDLLSSASQEPDTIDLNITLEGGQMRLGFIPLGAAPKIVLH